MPYFFYLLRLALLNKSNWSLEKIREVKEMTSILGLSTDWDDFYGKKILMSYLQQIRQMKPSLYLKLY